MNENISDKHKCKWHAMSAKGPKPNVSWYHNCVVGKYETARQKLATARHEKMLAARAQAKVLERQAELYNKLSKVAGTHRTRGSWYDTEKRAARLVKLHDMRRIGC